jgi:hypothetical protein
LRLSDKEYILRKSGILSSRLDASKLAVVNNGMYYAVRYGEVKVGVLNTKLQNALRILQGLSKIRQELEVVPQDFEASIQRWKDKGKGADLNLEINLYGPRTIKDTIGRLLSDSQIYLEQPRSLGRNMIVDNPHMIHFSHLPSTTEQENGLNTSLTTIGTLEARNLNVSMVLEGLDQRELLDTAEVQSCVVSPLLE